jgi:hypothetical protein
MHLTNRPLHTRNRALTILRPGIITTRRAVIVEEAVEPRAVDEDVVGVQDAETPGVGAGRGGRTGGGEDGVVEGGDGGEGVRGGGVWLVVGCFGLDEAGVDVLCVGELVLVECVVLYCCADSVVLLV